jgi:hypothetical protein
VLELLCHWHRRWEGTPHAQYRGLLISQSVSLPNHVHTEELRLKLSHYNHGGAWGGRGGIASTHPRPRHWMRCVVSVTPRPRFSGRKPRYALHRRLGGPQSRSGHRSYLCRGSNLDRPVVQPVVRHHTDWATRLTTFTLKEQINYVTKRCGRCTIVLQRSKETI